MYPGARRTEVGGCYGEGADRELIVRVIAPALDGRANEAVVEALADAFGVRSRAVNLVSGARSRHKLVEVDGADRDRLDRLLGAGEASG